MGVRDEWGRLLLDFESLSYGVHVPITFETPAICLGMGDENNLGPNSKVRTRPHKGCSSDRKGATLVGPSAIKAESLAPCGCNAHNGFCNRHGCRAKNACLEDFDDFINHLRTLSKEVADVYAMHFTEFSSQWITRWPAGKQKSIALSKQYDELRPDKVKCMVKREVSAKVPTKARCIQFYPNLATQSEFGPETASLQKTWCQVLHRRRIGTCRITFSSGMDANKLGSWMDEVLADYTNPVFYERDGKNWDATMGEKHHKVKVEAYKCAGQDFVDFINKSAKVKGVGVFKNGILRYKLDYTTKSGHNDTTLGNNLINAAVTWTAFEGLTCDILIAGDDLLVVVEGDFNEHAIAEKEKRCGIMPEYRKFYNVEDVTYISGLFATTDKGIKFIAKPGRLLALLFWTVKPPSPKPRMLRGYQRGVAKGVLPTMGCVPVVGPWLQAIGDEGFTIPDKSRRRYTYGVTVDADFSGWFERRYGLSKTDISRIEELLVSVGPKRCIIRDPVLERIVSRDLADIDVRETLESRDH